MRQTQQGDWAFGFAAADEALKRADAVAAIHNADAECLAAVVPHRCLSVLLPFLDADPFLAASTNAKPLAASPLKLLSVGMMRKVTSSALTKCLPRHWSNFETCPGI